MKNSKNFFYGMLLVSISLLASSGFGGDIVLSLGVSNLIATFLGNVYSLVHTWQFIPFVGGIVLIVFGIIKE